MPVRIASPDAGVRVADQANRVAIIDRGGKTQVVSRLQPVQVRRTDQPVRVRREDPLVRISGVAGVQGRHGAPGGTIAPIAFSYGDAPGTVYQPPAAGTLAVVRIKITTPFNGAGAKVQIGTAGDEDAFMPADYSDPAQAEEFEYTPDVHVAAGTAVRMTIDPAGSTAGAGLVFLTFLPD
jgi:hypothetical protein